MRPKARHKYLLQTAKSRNIEVRLNSHHYNELINLGCAFCGDTLIDKNGVCLDRLDNSKGYLDSNIAPCCRRCNVAKNDMKDQNEFFDWIDRVVAHRDAVIKRMGEYADMTEKEHRKYVNVVMNSSRMRNAKVLIYKPEISKVKKK
jgi:hypothetical protein